MRKRLMTTTLAMTIGLSTIGAIPQIAEPLEVSAATVSPHIYERAAEVKANQLILTARSLIGKATYSTATYKPTAPYQFSCATFLMYIFEKHGVDLGTYNEDYMMQQGTPVSRNQLKKGDLVFFDSRGGKTPNHVAMYIGDNKVIHMADSKQNIVISDMNSKSYYKDSYIGARRVIPSLMTSVSATKGDRIVKLSYDLKDRVRMGSVNNEASLRFTGAGYVNYLYKKNGVNLNTTNPRELMKKGATVSKANLRKGDLVFFNSVKGSKTPSIVGIYAGEHRVIVPNSSGVLTRVLLADYYKEHYITAKRVY